MFEEYEEMIMKKEKVWNFKDEWRWKKKIKGKKMERYNRWMEVVVKV